MSNLAFCATPGSNDKEELAISRFSCLITRLGLVSFLHLGSADAEAAIPTFQEAFKLIAKSENDPADIREEEFWRSVYQHEDDRLLEAARFALHWNERGYQVIYVEVEQ